MSKAKRWKPKQGEVYFTVNNIFGVTRLCWLDDEDDNDAYTLGNCFQTTEEAEAVARKLKGFWKDVREGR